MKRVLIVEDNDFKFQQLLAALPEFARNHHRVKTFRLALPAIRGGAYDLVILDMTFQVVEVSGQTDSLEALAGLQVLQYMKRIDKSIPVVVTTQHNTFQQPGTKAIRGIPALDKLLRKGFSAFYIGCVYMAEGNGWETDLRNFLQDYIQ